jgi:hypothetical protein
MASEGTVRPSSACDFGWLDAREVTLTQQHAVTRHFVAIGFAAAYPRFLPPDECRKLRELSLDLGKFTRNKVREDVFPD